MTTRRVLFFVLATVMLAWSSGVHAGCCCPTFWTAFGKHCYRFFGYNMSMHDAEEFCQRFTKPSNGYGGTVPDSLAHLVSIHSQEEQFFVQSFFEASRKRETPGSAKMWLGLQDLTTEDHFEWTDGTAADFLYWAGNQPDDWRTGEDCVEMTEAQILNWNDVSCAHTTRAYYFMCKLNMW